MTRCETQTNVLSTLQQHPKFSEYFLWTEPAGSQVSFPKLWVWDLRMSGGFEPPRGSSIQSSSEHSPRCAALGQLNLLAQLSQAAPAVLPQEGLPTSNSDDSKYSEAKNLEGTYVEQNAFDEIFNNFYQHVEGDRPKKTHTANAVKAALFAANGERRLRSLSLPLFLTSLQLTLAGQMSGGENITTPRTKNPLFQTPLVKKFELPVSSSFKKPQNGKFSFGHVSKVTAGIPISDTASFRPPDPYPCESSPEPARLLWGWRNLSEKNHALALLQESYHQRSCVPEIMSESDLSRSANTQNVLS